MGQTLPPALSGPSDSPRILDNMKLWATIAFVLVVLAYALPLGAIVADSGLLGPGGNAYPVIADVSRLLTEGFAEAADAVVGVVR
jgi:cytochrome c oxidase subunit 1